MIPPFPLSVVLFPVFFHFHQKDYILTAQWTADGLLAAATLEVFEMSRFRALLFFGSSSYRVRLTEGEIAALKRLEKKGLSVKIAVTPFLCFGGILGWESVPLEVFLRDPPKD